MDTSGATGRNRIYTFYSFKGGVGRSMALANVAALLAAWDQRVLVVDWDLEAPGLERYFEPFLLDRQAPADTPGVVDLAEAISLEQPLNWRDCLVEASPFPDGQPVSLITAGRGDERFLARLQGLDWERLFVEHDFGSHLEQLRREWLDAFDYVLVDSRTGFSDTGGICTIYLPDVLVVLFTANLQSVQGVADVVRRARAARDRLPFDRGHLFAVPVPSRDESRSEYEQALEWRKTYAEQLGDLYRDFLPQGVDAAAALDLLRIPYVPYWSFGERLPVVQEGTRDPSSIGGAFAVLANLIASGLGWPETGDTGDSTTVLTGDTELRGSLVAGRDLQITTTQPLTAALFQLPSALSDFTGREAELATLKGKVQAARSGGTGVEILVLTGPPGVGKTALAVTLAQQLAAEFPDAQLYMKLGGRGPDEVDAREALAELLRAFGVPPGQLPDDVEQLARHYRSTLAGRRALILLDDVASEAQVRPLLPGSPSCLMIVTSRRWLTGLEGATQVAVEVLPLVDAVQLLAVIAGPGRVVSEPAAAEQIVRLCGFLPLAIRIAGARLAARPHWTLDRLADRLANERTLLAELTIRDLEVRSTFQLGYRDLAESERRVFRLLGLLPTSDFSADAVAALLDIDQSEAEDLMDSLVEAQFLEAAADSTGQIRYRLFDLLRVFARERAWSEIPPSDQEAALRRLLNWYVATASAASDTLEWVQREGHDEGMGFDDVGAALAWLDTERSAVVAAISLAHGHGWWPPAWRLATALLPFFELRGHWGDWVKTGELGLDAARRSDNPRAEALMLYHLGSMHRHRGDLDEALQSYTASIALFEELGDRWGHARALRGIGAVYRDSGGYHEALTALRESVALFQALGDPAGEARTLRGVGAILRELGEHGEAESLYRVSLAILERLGDRYGVALTLAKLGIVFADTRRFAAATESYEQSIAVFQEFGDLSSFAVTLVNLAAVDASAGRLQAAAERYQSSLRMFQEIGDPVHEGMVLRDLGRVAAARGEHQAALRFWQQSQQLLASVGHDGAQEVHELLQSSASSREQQWHPITR